MKNQLKKPARWLCIYKSLKSSRKLLKFSCIDSQQNLLKKAIPLYLYLENTQTLQKFSQKM